MANATRERAGTAGSNHAFGFDLAPLVARADEFEALAEEIRAADRALRLVRERITLLRRDIAKMIATGIEEGVPTYTTGQGRADWAEFHETLPGHCRTPAAHSYARRAPADRRTADSARG